MDYEKNNEDLAIVRRMVADGQVSQEVAEKYFPELAESEDDKIRKAILEHIKGIKSWEYFLGISKEQMIAWLEKQGEKDNLSVDFVLGYLGIKPAYKDGNAWCILLGDNIQEGICGFGDTKEEALIAFMKELIEKQGEQKQELLTKEKALKNSPFVEQKPADKVEPKFRVGDKVKKGYLTYTVEDIDEDSYKLQAYSKDGDKGCTAFLSIGCEKDYELVERNLRMILWKGDNLKEVIDFTGKDKNFDKWFESFEEYEKFVREHEGILKLFNEDGSHYEVPVGAWIVKTPDGYNVASKAVFKQKPTWSEEDERLFQIIIDILDKEEHKGHLSHTDLIACVRKLKDLKDRVQFPNTWKPSDEQMKVLDVAIKSSHLTTAEYDGLVKLREQLKKL